MLPQTFAKRSRRWDRAGESARFSDARRFRRLGSPLRRTVTRPARGWFGRVEGPTRRGIAVLAEEPVMRSRARGRRVRPLFERLGERCLLSGFAPADIAAAYGLAPIVFSSPEGRAVVGDGAGQTIAIVGAYHNPNLESDLRVFSREFNLPDADLTVVSLAEGRIEPLWAVESALDVEWAHALAPGASILMVEARSDSAPDMLEAVDIARNTPGVVVVSMSWGFPETPGQRVYDAHFTTPAGQPGITFVSASGDHGPEGGAVYPASSPNVLGVGGTSVSIGPDGAVDAESVWALSGVGLSRYSAQPSYQMGTRFGGRKSTPDVAFLGDPDTGVRVYHTAPGEVEGSWRVMAGTSLGAPAWSAIMAIVTQGRAIGGQPSLDGPSQTLPMLYRLGPSNFRSVESSNVLAQGRGVPNGRALIPALVSGDSTAAGSRAAAPVASPAASRAPRVQAPPVRQRPALFPRIARPPARWGGFAGLPGGGAAGGRSVLAGLARRGYS